MIPIVRYYLHQAGRGYGGTNIGQIYSVTQFVRRGHVKGNVLTGFWRWIKPILWSKAKKSVQVVRFWPIWRKTRILT